MSNDSQATLAGLHATGLAIGGVNSAVTGDSQAVLQLVTAAGRDGALNTSAATLQTVTATGTASSSPALGPQRIVASGTAISGAVGASAAVLERVVASGNVYPAGLSAASPQPVAASGVAYGGVRGDSSATLQLLSADGLAGAVAVGRSSATLPQWLASGQAYLGTGASFSAVVMHTESQSLWTYSNFPFNSFARFNGVVLAAGDAGLFTLGGADDAGVKINAQATFGDTDFSTAHLKRLERVYLGYRSSGEMILRVTVDETKTRDYLVPANTPINTGLHGRHVRLGKGVEAKYFQFSVLNRNGSDFSLNIIECKPTVLRRRVGGGIDA